MARIRRRASGCSSTNRRARERDRARKRTVRLREIPRTSFRAAFESTDSSSPSYLGINDQICIHCSAKNFGFERTGSKSSFTICCQKGKVSLDPTHYPEPFKSLLIGAHPLKEHFRENIRKYNSALSFTTFLANVNHLHGSGVYFLRVFGSIHHIISSLQNREAGGQIYILDAQEAMDLRSSHPANSNLLPEIFNMLHENLRDINPYAQSFTNLHSLQQREDELSRRTGEAPKHYGLEFFENRSDNPGRGNLPTVSEVAAVFETEDGTPPSANLRVYPAGRSSTTLKKTSRHIDPMSYPLIWPLGERGWSTDLEHDVERRTASRNRMTFREFTCFRLAERSGYFSAVNHCGKLTQQFYVDSYVRYEGQRLDWIRAHQKDLRIEIFAGLEEFIQNLNQLESIRCGRRVILPSSFSGSPRNMSKRYQDAMAVVRQCGKPNFFITMTSNPNWPEITDSMLPGEKPWMRPDIVVRVFNGKVQELCDLITKRKIFGSVVSLLYVIEFQKRGQPHVHLLLTVSENDKPTLSDDIDKVISAEIPDPSTCPILHSLVIKHMIHGPCGALHQSSKCLDTDGKCTKGFPKPFQVGTRVNEDGYPLYKRRAGSFTHSVRANGITVEVDNSFVVPYNRFLLTHFKSHINVEICGTVKATKYLHKYVYKGYDQSNIRLRSFNDGNVDEIESFLQSRYVGPTEAAHRLFEIPMYKSLHTVVDLPVHLPKENFVIFRNTDEIEAAAEAATRNTKLTAWFDLNIMTENSVSYLDMPKYFRWLQNKWIPRVRDSPNIVSRLHIVPPKQAERFALRLLLLHATGVKSFEDLKRHAGILHNTFQEAARAAGLIQDESEWIRCLDELTHVCMPRQLRETYAYILIYSSPVNGKELFQRYQQRLIEDFLQEHDETNASFKALAHINSILEIHGRSFSEFGIQFEPQNCTVETYSDQQLNAFRDDFNSFHQSCTSEQKSIIDEIIFAADNTQQSCTTTFFIEGPGGTGKTAIYNALISYMLSNNKVVIPVAWTGTAATLLRGGRTSHSRFGIPIMLTETSVSSIKAQSREARLLAQAALILWDKASMIPNRALTVVDELLKDIMVTHKPFGGKVIVLGGDFRQILPVCKNGGRVETVNNCLKKCALWKEFKILKLTRNMRVGGDEEYFREMLLRIGEGRYNNILPPFGITLPSQIVIHSDEDLIEKVYGNYFDFVIDPASVAKKAILCPRNYDCNEINNRIIEKMPGQERIYTSTDAVINDEQNTLQFPVEYLNSLSISGLPPHQLRLKKGAIVILLRNLNLSAGLTNGTRLCVVEMYNNSLLCKILTGHAAGDSVILPRIDMTPSDQTLPFQFKRRQIPVNLAFAITINKAQGQTLESVGVCLKQPVFSHGQLYVALSRAKSIQDLKVELTERNSNQRISCLTQNVVYEEIL